MDKKPKYEPPKAMRLTSLDAGGGLCFDTGSSDFDRCEHNGNYAGGMGCQDNGMSASGWGCETGESVGECTPGSSIYG